MRAFDTWYVDVNKLGGFMRGVYSLDYETHSHPYWSCIFDYFVKKKFYQKCDETKKFEPNEGRVVGFFVSFFFFFFLNIDRQQIII